MIKMAVLLIHALFLFSGCQILNAEKTNPPVTLVIFGSTGDLSARKLYPAIYNLSLEEDGINSNFSVVGIGRRNLSQEEFQLSVYSALQKFSRNKPSIDSWNQFKPHVTYFQADFSKESDYVQLKAFLDKLDEETGRSGNYIFYLATESNYFPIIISNLHKQGLTDEKIETSFSRVIIEKPFGEDLDSAVQLQSTILQSLDEKQIFRMDHYLGKKGVHKLVKFRFQDSKYETLFDRKYVKNIQITLSETIGIGTRANFYEKTGHLRDVMQNHAMQLLALATMEQPAGFQPEDIYSEKARLLDAIRPFSDVDMDQEIIRGQYTSGMINGTPVIGYRQENDVPEHSQVETFVQTRMFIDNERWRGVPVYIKSGKRLPEQTTQITLNLKQNPLQIDAIHFVIQPNSRIYLTKNGVREMYEIEIDASLTRREEYENLILAAIQGDQSHFITIKEVISTWTLLTPVLNHWLNSANVFLHPYAAGQWGPEAADRQIKSDKVEWNIITDK